LPKEEKEKYTPKIIDIALSDDSNIRKFISNTYPVCAITPEFEIFLKKLIETPKVESDVKMNAKKALKKFFNPVAWIRSLSTPSAISFYLFTIGTFCNYLFINI